MNALREYKEMNSDKELIHFIYDTFDIKDPIELMMVSTIPVEIPDKWLKRMRESKSISIRRICALNGRDEDLDVLVNDPSDFVRMPVLYHKRPKDLAILSEDRDVDIRQAARAYLASNCEYQGILGRW